MMSTTIYYLAFLSLLSFCTAGSSDWIIYPDSGFATMTHYTIPLDFVASCGCTAESTHYPTAALNQMAFGSSTAFGRSCGRCFNLTLLEAFTASPPFYPNVTKSVVIKVTDLCPLGGKWCSATKSKMNSAGLQLNFDLAWPSSSIPDDFFPSNATEYGYTDFGVWNVSYQSVPCEDDWEGSTNSSAFGADALLGPESVCCPTDPWANSNTTCQSYSDLNGIPPEKTPAHSKAPSHIDPGSTTIAIITLSFLSLSLLSLR